MDSKEINNDERIFLMKIRELSKCHTCNYNGLLNLLLEMALHFSTKEIVDLLEVKRYL